MVGGHTAPVELSPAHSDSSLRRFMQLCEHASGRSFHDPRDFHDFSVANMRTFWRLLLDWSRLPVEGSPDPVCNGDSCEHAAFFPALRLSYAEALLAGEHDPASPAVVALHAGRPPDRLTRAELLERVTSAAARLRELGLRPGDRVAAVAANDADAVVAALACAALGATFSAAAPEMGVQAVLSRFEQLEPKLLMTAPGTRREEIAAALPSLEAAIALDDESLRAAAPVAELERFPFNQALFVLFTSGTTGPPKCVVHGAGGTLLEHVKEQRLHVDLRPGDRLFFHTSAAWMMWNWQLSALASGACIVLYDGPIEGPSTLWRIAAEERVTAFGTSPPYLQLCEDARYTPRAEHDLSALRTVLSTGSILHDWQFDWVAEHVGPVPVHSISGGTDIVGCFVLGNPELPVRRGWLQCRSLAMDVQSLDGELVCRNPFPSRPLGLLGDADGSGFHDTYFAANPGVWTHGDLIEFDGEGNARLHGRSDGVMNVHGQRVGPAEIYRALGGVPELVETMAVERDERVVLLVVLREGAALDGRLIVRIRRAIARATTPAHVPELVVAVDELPTTHSGKRSERAAHDALAGGPSSNAAALANPASLDAIRAAVEGALRARSAGDPGALLLQGSTEQRLIAIWEAVLGVAPLQPDDDFFDVGGTSLVALRLLDAIHEHMGLELPLSILVDAPTVEAMARAIDDPAADWSRRVVLLRPGAGGRPLFVVHSVLGEVLTMRPLAQALDVDRAVFGLQAKPGEEPRNRVDRLAEAYVESIRSVQPDGPYSLCGHSFGGLVAFEMARRLLERGDGVEWLALLDSDLHHACLTPGQRLRRLAWKSGDLARRAAGRDRGPELPPLVRRLEKAGWQAFEAYRPAPYAGPATLFRATERGRMGDPLPVWRRVVEGGLDVVPVPGTHTGMLAEPSLSVLAARMSDQLKAAASASGQRSRHS